MARPKLSNVSTASLQAELQRRTARLSGLIAQRDKLDKQIAELQAVAGRPAAAVPKPAAKAKGGRKPKAVKAEGRKRKSYAVTAEQLVLGLVKDRGATTAEINKAWKGAGRTGRADNTLNKMVKAGKLKREKLQGQKGSRYTQAS